MLKGWNRKVRITSAISRAWMTTRMVSAKPLSVFVPDVTLIAFPIPGAISPRGGRAFSSRESLFVSRQENGPDSDSESEFRRKPELALAEGAARGFRRLFAAAQSTVSSKLPNPLTNQVFLVLRAAARVCPGNSRFARMDRRNYDEGLRQWPVIGNAQIDSRLMPVGRQRREPGQRAAGELHGRTAARQVHHPHIAPPDASPDSRAERLGTGLLGGEALGVGRHHHFLVFGPALGPGALGVGENAVQEAVAMTLDDFGDAADVDQVRADADDHDLPG